MLQPPQHPREQRILALVRDRGFLDIGDLSRQFEVTPQTIRRSVNRLCEQGMLRRLHGGVTLPPASTNLPYETRQVQRLEGKRRIAAAVAERIAEGSSVSIGLGTTPLQVALALRGHADLRVITNSMHVVFALAGCPGIEVAVAGGFLRGNDLDIVGSAAARFFAEFKTDYAVFGVGGIDEDGTLLDFDPEEVSAREAMRENCRQSMLVADASKFGRNALARGGRLAALDHCLVDEAPPPAFAALFESARPRLHVAAAATAEAGVQR